MSSNVLKSWKEIAQYMGRGVRTVQRWEKLGLPVRRQDGTARGEVAAFTDDLDEWLKKCPRQNLSRDESRVVPINRVPHQAVNVDARAEMHELRTRYRTALNGLMAQVELLTERSGTKNNKE